MAKSTTPKSDALAAKYRAYDEQCVFDRGNWPNLLAATCPQCQSHMKHVMSAYAMSKGPDDRLLICVCGQTLVWFTLLSASEADKERA